MAERRFGPVGSIFCVAVMAAFQVHCAGDGSAATDDASASSDDGGAIGTDSGSGDDSSALGFDAGTSGDDSTAPGDDSTAPSGDSSPPSDDSSNPAVDTGTPVDTGVPADTGAPADSGTPPTDGGTGCLANLSAACQCQGGNPSDITICKSSYIPCYINNHCDPTQACGSNSGICGVNTLGGGSAPQSDALNAYKCACPNNQVP